MSGAKKDTEMVAKATRKTTRAEIRESRLAAIEQELASIPPASDLDTQIKNAEKTVSLLQQQRATLQTRTGRKDHTGSSVKSIDPLIAKINTLEKQLAKNERATKLATQNLVALKAQRPGIGSQIASALSAIWKSLTSSSRSQPLKTKEVTEQVNFVAQDLPTDIVQKTSTIDHLAAELRAALNKINHRSNTLTSQDSSHSSVKSSNDGETPKP